MIALKKIVHFIWFGYWRLLAITFTGFSTAMVGCVTFYALSWPIRHWGELLPRGWMTIIIMAFLFWIPIGTIIAIIGAFIIWMFGSIFLSLLGFNVLTPFD